MPLPDTRRRGVRAACLVIGVPSESTRVLAPEYLRCNRVGRLPSGWSVDDEAIYRINQDDLVRYATVLVGWTAAEDVVPPWSCELWLAAG